jgi:hypothetical protein
MPIMTLMFNKKSPAATVPRGIFFMLIFQHIPLDSKHFFIYGEPQKIYNYNNYLKYYAV